MANRFIQYFENSFKRNWEHPALTNYETKQTYTYKDLAREIARLHVLFKELDIQQDDKIAIIGSNTPEWAIVFLATITYGAISVPILQNFHRDDISNLLNHSDSKLLFIKDSSWNQIKGIEKPSYLRAVFSLSDFRCIYQAQGELLHVISKELPKLFKEKFSNGIQPQDVQYTEKDDEEVCVLNYTSGTSGFCKGVMLTGDNFMAILEFINSHRFCLQEDRFLVLLPLAHMYGCFFYLILPITSGSHITLLPTYPDFNTLSKTIMEIKPANLIIVPVVMESIYKKLISPILNRRFIKIAKYIPFISSRIYSKFRKELMEMLGGECRNIFIGGASLNREVEDFMLKAKIPYRVGYGMTECTASITLNCIKSSPYSVGTRVNGTSVKIDSENAQKIPGEILVKGRNVMKGYYKDGVATRDAFTADGWFKTGDIGTMDKQGNLYIKGRCKTMILTSSGQNVYPEEIEAKLNDSDYIEESLVIQRGDKIVALIVPKKLDPERDINKIIGEVVKNVNNHLPSYASIHFFEIQSKGFEKTPKNSLKRYLYK